MREFTIWPHELLTRPAQPRPIDASLLAVGNILREAAAGVEAYGLAAAHIGLVEPVVVISVSEDKQARDYLLLYNPKIVATADETLVGAEGSVSMPGIEVPIARPIWADIYYDDADGVRRSVRVDGFVARVALHEIEQMTGVFFLSRLSRIKRDTAIRKFQKSLR